MTGAAGPWFYAPSLPAEGGVVKLPEDEGAHARGPLRLEDGADVVVFDGCGRYSAAVLRIEGRRGPVGAFLQPPLLVPAPEPEIELAFAVPKGDRSATLLDAATELGVNTFVPLRADRSHSTFDERLRPRWARIVLEAAKQSRRPWLPTLRQGTTPLDAARDAVRRGLRVVLADPEGPPVLSNLPESAGTCVLIGPEGGFSDREREAILGVGAVPWSLSDAILRVEVAAIAAVHGLRLARIRG